MSELIERQAVIDLWNKYHPTIAVDAMQYDAELRQLPHAQPEPCEDGTLWITIPDINKVERVIVDERKSKFCKTFYQDACYENEQQMIMREGHKEMEKSKQILKDLQSSAHSEPFGTINHAGSEHPLSDDEIIPRLREIRDQVGGSYAIDRAIELLTAQPEQRWIPITERLPKQYQEVLICGGRYIIKCAQLIGNIFECDEIDLYGSIDGSKVIGADTFNVSAWMPLPKPYEMEGNVE